MSAKHALLIIYDATSHQGTRQQQQQQACPRSTAFFRINFFIIIIHGAPLTRLLQLCVHIVHLIQLDDRKAKTASRINDNTCTQLVRLSII